MRLKPIIIRSRLILIVPNWMPTILLDLVVHITSEILGWSVPESAGSAIPAFYCPTARIAALAGPYFQILVLSASYAKQNLIIDAPEAAFLLDNQALCSVSSIRLQPSEYPLSGLFRLLTCTVLLRYFLSCITVLAQNQLLFVTTQNGRLLHFASGLGSSSP